LAENLPAQQFETTAPSRVLLSDITCISTGEGWLYLAAHKDLFSKESFGYAMGPG